MNCICEFLYDLLPITSSKVQAWASVITAGVAGYALFSWKHQKRFDLMVEAVSRISQIKTICMQEIFTYQLALDELKNAQEQNTLTINDIYTIGEKINQISDKYDSLLFEVGYYKTIELLKRGIINDVVVKTYFLSMENARNTLLTDVLIKIIIKYVDEKIEINQNNVNECIEDFRGFAKDTLPKLSKEYQEIDKKLKP